MSPEPHSASHDTTGALPEPEIIIRVEGNLGRITLNRPRAINALTPAMISEIRAALDEWRTDPDVSAVLLDGAGDRGLCAGADIRKIAAMTSTESEAFFREEYSLNLAISRYPKPYISVMDGVTMGGGVGLSAHGSLRIVTERSRIAMPEVRIGLTPDVGSAHLLSRAPGGLGLYLGLTATEMRAADALYAGFADVLVLSENIPPLITALVDQAPQTVAVAREAVNRFTSPAGDSALVTERSWIDRAFHNATIEKTLGALNTSGEREQAAAETIMQMSPTSIMVAFRAIRNASLMSLAEVLEQDYSTVTALQQRADFREGVRAQVVDKDRNPHWRPASLPEVTDKQLEKIFASKQ